MTLSHTMPVELFNAINRQQLRKGDKIGTWTIKTFMLQGGELVAYCVKDTAHPNYPNRTTQKHRRFNIN